MTIQLIFKADDVKALSPISQNLAGEYMGAAMYEAQEIRLKSIVGGGLLATLRAHEVAKDWEQFPAYEDLREQCLPLLVYQTIVNLIPKVSYKIANVGAVQTSDANVQNLSREDMDALVDDYQAKADYFCYELQKWLLANSKHFPELGCQCEEISANLQSMATCGVWLGGPRGDMGGCGR